MSFYNDNDIPIRCAECNVLTVGVPAMMSHVIDFHPNYSIEEVRDYAESWADGRYAEEDEWNMQEAQRHG